MGCGCCVGGCEKDVRISFCPKCKSRRVGYVFGLGNVFGIIPKMKCQACGFDAPSFPVLITTDKKLKKTVKEMKAKAKKKTIRRKKK
jgi:hypothetical protein